MNIAIVGAGINGISTALELARDGHQVTVYEQRNAAAEGASFAPGGWLSPCTLQTLATPGAGMPLQQLRAGGALRLQNSAFWGNRTWRWLRHWKKCEREALKHHHEHLRQSLASLSQYSQSLRWLGCEAPEEVAEKNSSALVLIRTPKEWDMWQHRALHLQDEGHTCTLLTAEQARLAEPALDGDLPLAGAAHLPDAESINTRLWTQHLRQQAQLAGVMFHTGTHVQGIQPEQGCLLIDGQPHHHDHIVICTGSPHNLLEQANIKLPSLSTWGYSVTTPIRDALHAPRHAIMDWEQQACITRMGQRLCITCGAELGSTADTPHHAPTLQRMYTLLNDWFPGGAQLSSPQVQVWRGARHTLPDGLPATGPSAHPRVWLNLAHGSHGAALAAGCARALADMLQGQATAIDMQAFSPQRFA